MVSFLAGSLTNKLLESVPSSDNSLAVWTVLRVLLPCLAVS